VTKVYILYDGRAATGDTDKASVLEAMSKFDREDWEFWRGHDGVLFAYDQEGVRAKNERMIGHLCEGYEALKAKL